MKIYKTFAQFADDKNPCMSKNVKKQIKNQLRVFESEFAADDENSVVLLENGECLTDLYKDFPQLEKIRPENSHSIDNYINQVYVTAQNGAGTSVFLPIESPSRENEPLPQMGYFTPGRPTL